MPVIRKRFSKCGHLGLGVSCARCKQANLLEQLIKENKFYVTNKKTDKPRIWTHKEMREEIIRLRAAAEKKNNFASSADRPIADMFDDDATNTEKVVKTIISKI